MTNPAVIQVPTRYCVCGCGQAIPRPAGKNWQWYVHQKYFSPEHYKRHVNEATYKAANRPAKKAKKIVCAANPEGGSHVLREKRNERGELVRVPGGTPFTCVFCGEVQVCPDPLL